MFTRCDNLAIAQVTATGGFITEATPGQGDWFVDLSGGVTTTNTVGGVVYSYRDGIPQRTTSGNDSALRVWMIQKVFNSVDDLVGPAVWSAPTLLADNTNTDYQYHAGDGIDHLTKPADPTGTGTNPDSTGWYDSPDLVPGAGAYWIAQRNWSEGASAQWKVYQIRGEDGQDGLADWVFPLQYWYSKFHPGHPGGPTTDAIGTPDSDPAYWTETQETQTTLNYARLDRMVLASWWKIAWDPNTETWGTKTSLGTSVGDKFLGEIYIDPNDQITRIKDTANQNQTYFNVSDIAAYWRPGDYATIAADSNVPAGLAGFGVVPGDDIYWEPNNVYPWQPLNAGLLWRPDLT